MIPLCLSVCKCVINVTSCSAGNFAHELFLDRNASVAVSFLQKGRDQRPVCPVQFVKLYIICENTKMNLSWPCKLFFNRLVQLLTEMLSNSVC